MNREKTYPSTLTEKDCDDWFSILKGKKVTNAHPEIEQDARILSTIATEYQQEKQRELKGKKTSWFLNPQPAFALLFLTISIVFIYNAIKPNQEEETLGIDAPFYMSPTEGKSQSGLVNASNNPVIIEHINTYIEQLSKDLKPIAFEKTKYEKGIMVRIVITEKPNAELSKKLQLYGFNEEIGKQYMYFEEAVSKK